MSDASHHRDVSLPKLKPVEDTSLTSAGWCGLLFVIIGLVGGLGWWIYAHFFRFIPPPVYEAATTIETRLGDYHQASIAITPAIAPYQPATDLHDVLHYKPTLLSDGARQLLLSRGFVVTQQTSPDFKTAYRQIQTSGVPALITSDVVIDAFTRTWGAVLRQLRTDTLRQLLIDTTYGLATATKKQSERLVGTPWVGAAQRNLAIFSVANNLVYPTATIPESVRSVVKAELQLINRHQQKAVSPIIAGDYQQDYTVYGAPEILVSDDKARSFLQALTFLRQTTLRLDHPDEVRSAILFADLLKESPTLRESWQSLVEVVGFIDGSVMTVTPREVLPIFERFYDDGLSDDALTDQKLVEEVAAGVTKLAIVDPASLAITDQRFITPTSTSRITFLYPMRNPATTVFSHVVYPQVGDKDHRCETEPKNWLFDNSRQVPSLLDLAAVVGSTEAYNITRMGGVIDYACFDRNIRQLTDRVAHWSAPAWFDTLQQSWLRAAAPLLTNTEVIHPHGFLPAMTTVAWQRKELATFLAGWLTLQQSLKPDTFAALTTSVSSGLDVVPDTSDAVAIVPGYVEPQPVLYARLANVTALLQSGLAEHGLLTDMQRAVLDQLLILGRRLVEISHKELTVQPLTATDYAFISDAVDRLYGGIVTSGSATTLQTLGRDQNDTSLMAGTGPVAAVYMIVPIDDRLSLVRGGVSTYYEFTQPAQKPLSATSWQAMIRQRQLPALPTWMDVFVAK